MKKVLLLFVLLFIVVTTIKGQGGIVIPIYLSEEEPMIFLNGISRDGTRATGYVGYQFNSFTWTKDSGMDRFDLGIIGGSSAYAISNNSIVVGKFPDSTYMYTEEVWDEELEASIYIDIPLLSAGYFNGEKWISLGLSPQMDIEYQNGNITLSADFGSIVESISDDGKKMGGSWRTRADRDLLAPVIWNEGVGEELGFVRSGQGAKISALSADAEVAGGWAAPYYTRNPVVWKEGEMINITYQGLTLIGEVSGISANGQYAALTINSMAARYDIVNDKLTIIGSKEGSEGASATIVSNEGIVFGFNQTGFMIDQREAFVYTDQLGMIEMKDYLALLNVDIPTTLVFQTPMGISADGLKIVGFGDYQPESASYAFFAGWYIELTSHFLGLNPPRDLVVSEQGPGNINLVWNSPLEDSSNTFTGYNIYRNGVKINGSPVLATTYNDNDLPNGSYSYKITSLWNGNDESVAGAEARINTALMPIPFLDDFSGGNFDVNFWNTSVTYSNWIVSQFNGIDIPAASYDPPIGSDYEESITSPYINISSAEDMFLSYSILIAVDWDGSTDAEHFKVEIYDGTDWKIVEDYTPLPNTEASFFSHKEHNITELVAGKDNIRVRFTAFGTNKGSAISWSIDNVNIFSSEQALVIEIPTAVNAYIDDVTGFVRIDWADPNGVKKLSYLDSPNDPFGGMGNEGTSFIAASMYSSEDLKGFDGYYLTSISAGLTHFEYITEQPVYKLVAFQGATRILDQAIDSYTPNAWNKFELSSPIAIDAKEPLYFGVEVISHDAADWPIGLSYATMTPDEEGINYFNLYSGKANIYSEDEGVTWENLESIEELSYLNIAVYAELKKEITSAPKERILGYKVYREGINILDIQLNQEGSLTALNNYIDFQPVAAACYNVSAFYTTQQESAMSDESCVGEISAIKTIQTAGVEVYPNPAYNVINITGDIIEVSLYNLTGNKLLESSNNTMDVTKLSEGIYLLKIKIANGEVITKKIVKK